MLSGAKKHTKPQRVKHPNYKTQTLKKATNQCIMNLPTAKSLSASNPEPK